MAAKAEAPTRDYVKQLNIIGENTLQANYMPNFGVKFATYGDLTGGDDTYYLFRKDNEKLIDCIWKKESSRGQNMVGDNGLAIGHFQIHIAVNGVSEDCAMDYWCSSEYLIEQLMAGNSWKWPTYELCQKDSAIPATKF